MEKQGQTGQTEGWLGMCPWAHDWRKVLRIYKDEGWWVWTAEYVTYTQW